MEEQKRGMPKNQQASWKKIFNILISDNIKKWVMGHC